MRISVYLNCPTCDAERRVPVSVWRRGAKYCSRRCGDVAKIGASPGPSLPDRLNALIDRSAPGGCWLWLASKRKGYGRFRYGNREHKAHRIVYETLVGPIPDGLDLDHLCRNPSCVNPTHLEPVPHRINSLRGMAPSVVTVRDGVCQRGHLLTPDNTKWRNMPNGGRGILCRECIRIRRRRTRANQKARKEDHGASRAASFPTASTASALLIDT